MALVNESAPLFQYGNILLKLSALLFCLRLFLLGVRSYITVIYCCFALNIIYLGPITDHIL